MYEQTTQISKPVGGRGLGGACNHIHHFSKNKTSEEGIGDYSSEGYGENTDVATEIEYRKTIIQGKNTSLTKRVDCFTTVNLSDCKPKLERLCMHMYQASPQEPEGVGVVWT